MDRVATGIRLGHGTWQQSPTLGLRRPQVALEARETAAATLGSLQEQGQQLQRVNRDLDEVRPPSRV